MKTAVLSAEGFDWIFTGACALFVLGLFIDGWAHNHGRVDRSFFTLWHAIFYGGYGLTLLLLVARIGIGRWSGANRDATLPVAYRSALSGLLIFGAGGLGDMVWHTLFGIEEGVEALYSPTHLLLGIGILMTVSAPLWATWKRTGITPGWRRLGPAVVSAALLTATLTFFLMFVYPSTALIAGPDRGITRGDTGAVAGINGLMLTALFMLGPILLLVRRWKVPAGAISFILTLNIVAMTILSYRDSTSISVAGTMIIGVLVLDGSNQWLQKVTGVHTRLRILGALFPVVLFSAYLIGLLISAGTHWSVHLWGGAILFSSAAGFMLAFMLAPPPIPTESRHGDV